MPNKYLCDPRKNVECTKEGCRWRHKPPFGECFCTTKAEYALDNVPNPISNHDYRILENDPLFSLVLVFSKLSEDINLKCFSKEDKNA